MAIYLTELVPKTGLAAWYPLDNDGAQGVTIDDESGNGRDLTGDAFDAPPVVLDQINGRKAVVGDGTSYIVSRIYSGSLSLKNVFIIAKVDDVTTFPATYRGLFTGVDVTNQAIFVGTPSTTRFLSTAEGAPAYDYFKSGTAYANTARTAPFNYFEQLRMYQASGITFDGINMNRDREDTARQFNGKWCDAMFYTGTLTDAQLASLKLYGDLKFGLWLLNGTTLTYPNPDITGINWARFKAFPKSWGDVTDSWTYEDDGRDFNRRTDTVAKRWEIGYTGLTFAQMEIFDAFNDAVGIDRTFSFTDKWDEVHTGVRIESYSSNHDAHKSWSNTVDLTLVKHP